MSDLLCIMLGVPLCEYYFCCRIVLKNTAMLSVSFPVYDKAIMFAIIISVVHCFKMSGGSIYIIMSRQRLVAYCVASWELLMSLWTICEICLCFGKLVCMHRNIKYDIWTCFCWTSDTSIISFLLYAMLGGDYVIHYKRCWCNIYTSTEIL